MSRTTRPQRSAPAALLEPPQYVPTFTMPLIFAPEDVAHLPQQRRTALAYAQAAWLQRQTTQDSRLARYSRQCTVAELYQAACILMSLFHVTAAPQLTLGDALDWTSALIQSHYRAEDEHRTPPVALPYIWVARADLDALEALDRAAGTGDDALSMTGTASPRERAHRQRRRASRSTPRNTTANTSTTTERPAHASQDRHSDRYDSHDSSADQQSAPHVTHAARRREATSSRNETADTADAQAGEWGQRTGTSRTTGTAAGKSGKGGRRPRYASGVTAATGAARQ